MGAAAIGGVSEFGFEIDVRIRRQSRAGLGVPGQSDPTHQSNYGQPTRPDSPLLIAHCSLGDVLASSRVAWSPASLQNTLVVDRWTQPRAHPYAEAAERIRPEEAFSASRPKHRPCEPSGPNRSPSSSLCASPDRSVDRDNYALSQTVPSACTTQSAMTAEMRQSLADTALAIATAVKANDTDQVRSMSAPEIASNFDSTVFVIHQTSAAIANDTLRVTQLYRLDASTRKADDSAEAEFLGCALSGSTDEVDFAIPGLPPGVYAFAIVEGDGDRPWLLPVLLVQQEQPGRWPASIPTPAPQWDTTASGTGRRRALMQRPARSGSPGCSTVRLTSSCDPRTLSPAPI